MEEKSKEENEQHKTYNSENIVLSVAILLGVIVIVNVLITFSINSKVKESIEAAKEHAKPAKIELTLIQDSRCPDCFDVQSALNLIKGSNVDIKKQETLEISLPEAKSLISQYNIKKIPVVIISGEIEKLSLQGFEKSGNALVFSAVEPPYTDTAKDEIIGRVALTYIIDGSCSKCFDLAIFGEQLKAAGIKIVKESKLLVQSDEAKSLISKYNINTAPSLILSKDASAYELINKAWPPIGTVESDGSYVIRTVSPPYINLTSNKIQGLVNVIYLTDKSCGICYDVASHREILTNPHGINIALDNEKTVDISDNEGKALIAKHNISFVPTIILSEDISAYSSALSIRRFFSVKPDGSFVFISMESMGTYRNLDTGQIVAAPQQQ